MGKDNLGKPRDGQGIEDPGQQGQQEKHEREKKTELIEHIFKEYKSERGKEVRKSG